jgi:hypothetical protein
VSGGFFSRWSQKKRESTAEQTSEKGADALTLKQDVPAAEAVAATNSSASALANEQQSMPASMPEWSTTTTQTPRQKPSFSPWPNENSAPKTAPLPDVNALTPASDFAPFMARGVDAGVRNLAMKKLFTDPHFNVMDGLDIYIDDYGKPDPIPESWYAEMRQMKVLEKQEDDRKREHAKDHAQDTVVDAPLDATAPIAAREPEALPSETVSAEIAARTTQTEAQLTVPAVVETSDAQTTTAALTTTAPTITKPAHS